MRSLLARAVGKICPRWLASQREDLVQSACLRIFKKIQQAEESVHLETSYMWQVAHSVVMDEIRRRVRRPESGLEALADGAPVSGQGSPEREQEAASVRRAIADALGALEPSRRHAVMLYLQGFSLRESAGILGWNAKRVDNQRYKGLAQLRSILEEKGWRP